MNRSAIVTVFFSAALLSVLAPPSHAGERKLRTTAAASPFDDPPRGVILVIADDLGSDLVGSYGEIGLRTPHLDRLASQGTQFPLYFASASTCSPSRAALLTGLPSHQNGQYGIAHGASHFEQFETVRTLPGELAKAGAFVGWIGKTHVGPESIYPVHWTWDGDGRDVAGMAQGAANFLGRARGRPFLLIVGYVDPHRDFERSKVYGGAREIPYAASTVPIPPILPDRPPIRDDLAAYWQAISRFDQGVGALLAALSASGREDETLVILTSDNGAPFPGAKTNLTDAGIRLPFLVKQPVQIVRGVVCNALVSAYDVMPTALSWMRVALPDEVKLRGKSLLPILESPEPSGWNEIFASQSFHEVTMYYPMRAVRTRTHKLILNLASPLAFPLAEDIFASPTWQSIRYHVDARLGDRSLEAYRRRPAVELYDVVHDPGESRNLADAPAYALVVRDLTQRIRDWQEATHDPWFITSARD